MQSRKSFTFIELLIVIAIIAIIAAIVGVNLSSSQKRSRDTQRIADMNIIVSALNAYRRERGDFPEETISGGGNWETSIDQENFLEYLKPYLDKTPVDPKNSGNFYYAYRYYNSGSSSCLDENKNKPFYVLAIKSMEIEKNKFKEQATCAGYDWGDQFDYSIKIMK